MAGIRYWPFRARWAFAASAVLVPGAIASVTWLYRPHGPMAARLSLPPLLIAIALGLIPILLVVLSGVGAIEAGGVKVAFAAVREVVDTAGIITTRSLIADNLGAPPGRVADSGSDTIIETLKVAAGSHSVIVDLREGEDWWESRLLALASGASRVGYPKAVVFVATEVETRQRFLGWATPQDLLRRMLAREPALRLAHDSARRDWLLWQLSESRSAGQNLLPWANPGTATAAAGPWMHNTDGFEPERLLLNHVARLEQAPITRPGMTTVRLRELFGPVLHTTAIDRDDDESGWIRSILGSAEDYIAVTRGPEFLNMVSRVTAVNALLLALTSANRRT